MNAQFPATGTLCAHPSGRRVLATLNVAVLPQPVLSPVPDSGGFYEFVEPFRIRLPGERGVLVVDEGFMTDGASIPRLLWPVIGSPFDPDFMAPCAGAHDPLYAAELFPRAECDAIMRELMALNTQRSARMARTFHLAVRLGGGLTWRAHRRADVEWMRRSVRVETAGRPLR